MQIERIKINHIPAVIWGEKSNKVFIAVHGNMSNKEDEVIKILASTVTEIGYQVLSFDLPEHGDRKNDTEHLCKVQNCISDLKRIMKYAVANYEEINLWACSMGAYFGLLACKEEKINKCLFLSPIVNMKTVIENMMLCNHVTEASLRKKQQIKTDFGPTLYWEDYEYVKNNPVNNWKKNTFILYGNKDNMQNEETIKDFCSRYGCDLYIVEDGEHYFHTDVQLDFYKNWLDKIIKKN